MAAGQVRLRIDHGALQARVGDISRRAVRRGGDAAQKRYRENIISDGLVNTGGLANSVQQRDVPSSPLHPKVAVGSPKPYVKFPNFGTRAHGPVRASALRFTPKGSGRVVFAKWVRGVRPYRFANRALDQMRPTDFE